MATAQQGPGVREFDLLRSICRLITAYLGKPVSIRT